MPPAAAKSKHCMPGKFRPVLFSPSDLVWQNLLSPIFVSLKFKFAEDKNKMGAKYSLKTIYSCELPIPKNDFNFYRQRFEIFGMFLARQLTLWYSEPTAVIACTLYHTKQIAVWAWHDTLIQHLPLLPQAVMVWPPVSVDGLAGQLWTVTLQISSHCNSSCKQRGETL